MAYTKPFIAFQLEAARILARRFDLTLADALFHYTTFSKTVADNAPWEAFAAELAAADDVVDAVYRWSQTHADPDPRPGDATYVGRPLFGCFYYVIRDETVIRPHFIKNDAHGHPLSRARLPQRQAELRAMVAHVREHAPQATTVRGNSWLYNLEAYRRLYPPAYTAALPASDEGEFQFLARWGQLFDRNWDVRQPQGVAFLRALKQLRSLEELRRCFPYQILQPRCAVQHFFDFYGIEPPPV